MESEQDAGETPGSKETAEKGKERNGGGEKTIGKTKGISKNISELAGSDIYNLVFQ